jgi:hypothetical protein
MPDEPNGKPTAGNGAGRQPEEKADIDKLLRAS